MKAAIYLGNSRVAVETIETPAIGPGEMLVRVESCGVCHTDLKKIEYDLLPAPRIYGHEIAGTVVDVGAGVKKYEPGDRIIVFHHIPCGRCFYCDRRLYAQCSVYKRVGVTAGHAPAGGGFSQYVRVMDWIVERGVERIPASVSFDQACWVEPVNTCLKAVHLLAPAPADVVVILGQGAIGLIFTALVKRAGAQVVTTDTIAFRRGLSEKFGATASDPREPGFDESIQALTNGRGADAVILATNAPGLVDQALKISRPGAKVLLFAQTSASERIEISGSDICAGERSLIGSYSADVDLQAESARLVFSGDLPLEQLISHRLPLDQITRAIDIAQHPSGQSLKVVVHPQEHV
ncbi:MAG: alcohol dehydrogenase catalytic domain-containing protein [Acidobacteriaceae bacterium]|nr:alcohol dehydrogenase catalytic domain-containing protein [Acidobacteriaceae bacterium]